MPEETVSFRLIPVRGEEWMNEHFKSKFGVYSGVSADFEVGQIVTVQIYRVRISYLSMPHSFVLSVCPGILDGFSTPAVLLTDP